MIVRRIVVDTNVVVAGLRSRRGAAFLLLRLFGKGRFQTVLSVPLVLEYEGAIKRQSRVLGLTHADIDDVLNFLCKVSEHRRIFYLWRPFLRDPGDDMVLELAVEAEAEFIVTHNLRDFAGADRFGVRVVTPQAFLRHIGEIQ
ncbi:MAG: putative toxin-antitoxin system toxin component, PIN family [Planctomycetota bacterium]|jgi:putative PIN family toxin of toxin-antitoxin system